MINITFFSYVAAIVSSFMLLGACTQTQFVPKPANEQNQNAPAAGATPVYFQVGQVVTETFFGSDLGILDIVLVVDNSFSMRQELFNLSTKLEPLLSDIQKSNWKIGVITTDASSPKFRDVIKKGDINVGNRFADAVQAGLLGSGTERGILQAVQGLKVPGFLRSNSSVGVIIVSDEDNCSNGSCNSVDKNASYLLEYLQTNLRRPLGTMAKVFGLIFIPGDSSCKTGKNQGYIYKQAIEQSQGQMGSICAADYTQTLRGLSSLFKVMLQNQWELAQNPIQNSIKVYVDNTLLNLNEYMVLDRVVTLKRQPSANSVIKITYSTN